METFEQRDPLIPALEACATVKLEQRLPACRLGRLGSLSCSNLALIIPPYRHTQHWCEPSELGLGSSARHRKSAALGPCPLARAFHRSRPALVTCRLSVICIMADYLFLSSSWLQWKGFIPKTQAILKWYNLVWSSKHVPQRFLFRTRLI